MSTGSGQSKFEVCVYDWQGSVTVYRSLEAAWHQYRSEYATGLRAAGGVNWTDLYR